MYWELRTGTTSSKKFHYPFWLSRCSTGASAAKPAGKMRREKELWLALADHGDLRGIGIPSSSPFSGTYLALLSQ